MTLRLWGGKLLLPDDAGSPKPLADHEDCCCPDGCERCGFAAGIPPEFVADLGAGGWVDDWCHECDEVAGQYTLGHHDPTGSPANPIGRGWWITGMYTYDRRCYWSYFVEDYCLVDYLGMVNFHIDLWHANHWQGGWYWTVEIRMQEDWWFDGPNAAIVAVYDSEVTDNSDCFFFDGQDSDNKMTLTKFREARNVYPEGGLCTGNLPETIELWVP
jgi:hypothetical protein